MLVLKSVLVNIHTICVRNSHRICLVCVVDFVNGRLIATFINISLTVFVYIHLILCCKVILLYSIDVQPGPLRSCVEFIFV